MAIKLQEGDAIKFLNTLGTGIIKEILNEDKVLLEDNHGFVIEVFANEIVAVKNNDVIVNHINEGVITEKISQKNSITTKLPSGWSSSDVLEVDLHLHQLVEDESRLEEWQKLDKQMRHCKHHFEQAMHSKVQKIIFIHGVGKGVLKEKVHNFLAKQIDINFSDANSLEYGNGATEVNFIKKRT